ncbi:MAG TPA: hypothetical protein VKT28_02720 [Puia sp.]|nr:hypothetical protein [Puia sp.]
MENISELPFSEIDRSALQKRIQKGWFTLLRTYGAFFLALGYIYYRMYPGGNLRGRKLSYGNMTLSDYLHVYIIVAVFFGSIFLFFVVRDYRRILLPQYKDLRFGKKYSRSFYARKYADPIYNKRMLFYPEKENLYIELSAEEYDKIPDGEMLQLEYAVHSGEILSLKSKDIVFLTAEEFSFSDMPAPKFSKYYDD